MRMRKNRILKPGHPMVIFIASASRSGSTLLDLMLGSHPQGISTGELRRIQGFALEDKQLCGVQDEDYPLTCSCGAPVIRCAFWKKVEEEFGGSLRETRFRTQAGRAWRAWVMALYLALGGSILRRIAHVWPGLMREIRIGGNCLRLQEAISRVSGACFVVDSSKSIYHYMLLHLANPETLRLVVLVRDGRAVAHSMVRGHRAEQWKRGPKPPFLQAAKQWALTTRGILLLSSRTPTSNRMLIKYEDLCRDPAKILQEVTDRWGLPPWEGVFQETKKKRHIIGGSPSIRFEGSVRSIELDESWKEALSSEELKAFQKIAGRMNRKLGYV
jgi:hypothetical protein